MGWHGERRISCRAAKHINTAGLPLSMARDRVNMPMSTAGITRYFDDYKSKVEILPGHVLLLIGLVVLGIILMFSFAQGFFGIQ
ncbi:hypothetical protein COV94_05280 [Candidatus Woesearchaeota archaeon CG11_big_fil_rev_8_21_14_0_20_57_5]|nr:MAG: hypothetical protein COV94_05280 [Candidatus Woesearchaeota archaeon CG11_big_fil_rev_8_21_14_0_20_57_5]